MLFFIMCIITEIILEYEISKAHINKNLLFELGKLFDTCIIELKY